MEEIKLAGITHKGRVIPAKQILPATEKQRTYGSPLEEYWRKKVREYFAGAEYFPALLLMLETAKYFDRAIKSRLGNSMRNERSKILP